MDSKAIKGPDQGNRPRKHPGMLEKEPVKEYDDHGNLIRVAIKYRNEVFGIFESELYAELFNARCHDTGESTTIEVARAFREEILKRNSEKADIINLQSMKLGINSIISLANSLLGEKVTSLNLADNSLSDYGMHAIKTIIENTAIQHLNLASNMISGDGLETLVDSISNHRKLQTLDLGIFKGSIRKNSLGLNGASCIAAFLIKNSSLKTLILEDNDLGSDGGECFGLALTQNQSLKHLRITENDLKTEGSIFIINNSQNLESLDLSKNFITKEAGPALEKLLQTSNSIQKIKLEYNELQPEGIERMANGISANTSLRILNLKGNILGDDGTFHLVSALQGNETIRELNIGVNEIGPLGASSIAEVLPMTSITNLNISKNFLGDEALINFANSVCNEDLGCKLKYADFSSCRLNDRGVEYFFQMIESNKHLTHIKMNDNFISERLEDRLLQCLQNNYTVEVLTFGGNRIGHAAIKKIKKICERNKREQENAEPTRLKNEAYRLQYERRKLMNAENMLNQHTEEVKQIKAKREEIKSEMNEIRKTQQVKRENEKQKIEEEKRKIMEKESQISKIKVDLQETKTKYASEIDILQKEYEQKLARKNELIEQNAKIKAESEKSDNEFPLIVADLETQIESLRKEKKILDDEAKKYVEELKELKLEAERLKAESGEQEKKVSRKSSRRISTRGDTISPRKKTPS